MLLLWRDAGDRGFAVGPRGLRHAAYGSEGRVATGGCLRKFKQATRLKGSAEPICLGADLWANQDNVQSARVERDLEGKPMVILVLKEQSAARVRDLTSKNIGKSVGILINGELVVAPQIHAAATEIPIQGVYSPAQAQDLAAALNRQARS